jgi:hypothetical protein
MGRDKTWAWDHFFKPGHKFKTNKTNFAAQCNYCISANVRVVTAEAQNELSQLRIEVMPSKEELYKQGARPN